MKKVLIVTDVAFWENTYGSHMRIRSLLAHLAKEHEVIVFFLKSITAKISKDIAAIGLKNVKVISYKSYSRRDVPYRKLIGNIEFFSGRAPADFVSSLLSFLDENKVDLIIIEYIRLSYLLDGCRPGTPVVLDMHDVMSARTISLRQANLTPSIEMSARTEREILLRYDKLLAISRADVLHVDRLVGSERAIYVPHSVQEMPSHKVRSGFGGRLLFIGAETAPNISGLRWFLDQVWPMLQNDGFVLDVVGRACNAFDIAPEGVILHGQQDDLQPYFDAADIAINPVFVGGGLKIKCIDALANGLPCITTSEGAAGLELAQMAGLFIARSRLSFCSAIRYYSKSASARNFASILGPRYIASEFGDATAYRSLDAWISAGVGSNVRTTDSSEGLRRGIAYAG